MIARARLLAGLFLLALGLGALVAAASTAQRTYNLPDLEQQVPDEIGVMVVKGRERLVFSSTIINRGPGPFIIEGHRSSRRTPTMQASQVLMAADGHFTRVRDVGRMRYIHAPDHAHWHLLRLEVYELRDAATGRFVAPDRKTGFCPGDRYVVQRGLPRGWNRRLGSLRNENECGKGRVRALSVLESISPGWADVYKPNLEGQYIDITGVPAGEYVVVNRSNPSRRLRETNYDNDVSSTRIELRRPPGARPTATAVQYCRASATCP